MTHDPHRDGVPSPAGGRVDSSRRRAPLVPAAGHGVGTGLNLTMEMVAAVLTWGGVGWLVDRWLGTAPWALAAGLVLGNACGVYLLWLHSRSPEEVERAVQRTRRTKGERNGRG